MSDPRPFPIALKPMERLLYRSPIAAIGEYRCPPGHPLFRDSGPSATHAIVFARSVTAIDPWGAAPFVEGPDVISFFNRGVPYRQRRMSPEGARCDWFVVADRILLEAMRNRDPRVAEGEVRPFRVLHVPSTNALYLRQRAIVDSVRRGFVDESDVDEAILRLLEEVLARIEECRSARPRATGGARTRDLVAGAKAILAETYREKLEITAVAAELNVSVSYLCRLFRSHTGLSMSDYRRILRLRTALETLLDGDTDLGSLADGLGFASHSHFTLAFRRAFGLAPSRFRAVPSLAGAMESTLRM
jgi:AraC-like DNA-binding protein